MLLSTVDSLDKTYNDGTRITDLAFRDSVEWTALCAELHALLAAAPEWVLDVAELLAGFHSQKWTPASVLTVSRQLGVAQDRAAEMIDETRTYLRAAILDRPLIDLALVGIEVR
ncbi:hypothetical protein [Gryllotalpicola protaetiae]|uniref:Uncharacterized protein n=1 Tax=Gryllotalpicola protaetiae TaxID=2419771 RepID=A0A387BN43_9MICO|nr:hypothetical protein [Gryllotalpicola protaetiae]AYG03444.1 hypothetical protein D7I44_07765 [Gryllotalpicola protaetiae]